MNLDPKISDAGLSSSTSLSSPNATGQNNLDGQSVQSSTSFGAVLTSQANLFKSVSGKDSLDFAKLLSPNITQASQMIDKEKSMHEALVRADRVFQGNVNQIDLQNLIKDSLSYKLAATNPVQAYSNEKNATIVNPLLVQVTMGSQLSSAKGVFRNAEERFTVTEALKKEVDFGHRLNSGKVGFKNGEEATEDDLLNDFSKGRNSQSNPDEKEDAVEVAVLEGVSFVLPHSNIQSGEEMKTNIDLQMKMQSIFGSPEWIEELGLKTAILFSSDKQNAVINLNSDELGPLRILIHLDGDKVNVTFLSNDSQVCDAIQSGFEDLRAALLNAGVELNQAQVSSSASYQQTQAGLLHLATSDQTIGPTNPGKKLDLDTDLLTSTKIVSFYA